jgi:hypothetical protein
MSKKGAPTAINEATTPQVETAGPEVPVAAEPKPVPTLTADQKVQILTLQRTAILAQHQHEKAMAELNRAYQSVNTHQGFSLNELTLEFVSVQG